MERGIQPPLVDTTACLCRVDVGLKTVAGAKRFVPGSKLCLQPDIKASIHPTRQKPPRDRTRNQSPLLPGLPDDLAIACLIRVPRIDHRKLRLVCKRWYRLLAGNFFYSLRKNLEISEEWVYVMKRDKDRKMHWHGFDPMNHLWQPLPPVPKEYTEAEGFGCAVLSGCHLYLFGGKDLIKGSMRRVVYYSARTNKWHRAPDMLRRRHFFGSCVINNCLYVAGGENEGVHRSLRSVEVYDPSKNRWCFVADMSTAMVPFIGVVYGGRWFLKGLGSHQRVVSEMYQPETDVWTTVHDGMVAGWRNPSTCLNGKLYALGCKDGCKVRVYDDESDSWSKHIDSKMHMGNSKGLEAAGAPPEDAKKFKLGDPRTFHYLNQTNCYEVANIDDGREYLETRSAMDVVGINNDEQDAIFRVVAAILHLGNVDFIKGKEFDSSKVKDEKSLYHLRIAAELLMCDEKALEQSLCERVIVTPDGNITKPLDPPAAALSRDALAKTVYSRLFDWIVDKINNSIGQDPTAKSIIGVLDIYGFESFKINSFEQLCINLTNEKLQQHFNQHVFKMEQEEYTKEEINWSYVEFVDNQDVLDLIEKKPGGIIALLDEACMFPKATHETFAQKMYQTYKSHKRFAKPKLSRTNFTINHYAGDVTYQADHFLDKNKDYVVAEFQALLNDSRCSFVANLFPPLEDSSKQSKFSSIGTRFKQQLQSLMETLSTTEPHYIRCVKPNTVLKPGIFENDNVLNQLRCGGVLEAIRISCAGYPTKRSFDEFLERFGMLAPDVLDGSDEKSACVAICDRFGLKGYQIGKSKVFLRAGQMAELDARRAEVLATAARRIQRQIRTYLTRKEFIVLKKATINTQKNWRARLARMLYEYLRKEAASIRIQKRIRGGAARTSYKGLQVAAVTIQTGLRAMAARNEFRRRRRNKAATIVQTEWRRFHASLDYKNKKKATLTLQCLWRSKVARKELRMLKLAARDAGALREAKDKLEKRVEELTWRLDFEKHLRVDLEEAKGQEITKLQNALQEMQGKLEEAHNQIIYEKEAAKIAIEQAPPVIKEVPVVDNTKLEELTNQNHKLEDELLEFKKRVEEFEQKFSEIENESQNRFKELEESQAKISGLQETIERLDANLSNLESENQVLRQQALVASTNEELTEETEHLKSKIKELESENEILRNQKVVVEHITTPEKLSPPLQSLDNGHDKKDNFESPNSEQEKTKESESTPLTLTKQKSLTDRQQENHDVLIKCLLEDKRFDKTRPVAACIVYKTLVQWRSFEAEKTHIFDRIIHTIRSSIETQDNIKDLSYWLSTTSTLLFLLQSTIKASGSPYKSPHRNRASPTTLFGRMTKGFRTSPMGMGISSGYSGMEGKPSTQSKIEAKYPALLFKQHLTACVEKLYGMIRDSLKKEISPFLNSCIQAPRSTRVRPTRGASRNILSNIVAKQQASIIHWQSIVNSLDNTLTILSENYVPSIITRKIFSQVFSFIDVQFFNSLLLRRECCSFSNGEYVKSGLHELEQWCTKATDQFAGSSWDELRHIRQAVGLLVSHQKTQKSMEEITNELCPVLSVPQIYRIGTMFWDDKYGTQGLSQEVIGMMRSLMAEDSISMPNNSFLLDVDSSIPFSLEEISQSFLDVDLSEIDPPPLLRQRSDFHFLLGFVDCTPCSFLRKNCCNICAFVISNSSIATEKCWSTTTLLITK